MLERRHKNRFFKSGMTTLEYSVLAVVILAALLAMQVALRRVISGKWRSSGDSFGSGRQYEEGVTTIN